jgi:hypothetical protein
MERHAILFRVKPESRTAVRALLAGYDPPEHTTEDGTRLVSTSIFMSGDVVVRMMEIDGNLPSVMAHLAKQPSVQQLERDLDPHLAEPRDMRSPEGARAFFRSAMMDHVATRRADLAGAGGKAD